MSAPVGQGNGSSSDGGLRSAILFLGRAGDFLPLLILSAVAIALAVEWLQHSILLLVIPLVIAVGLALAERRFGHWLDWF